MNPETATVPPEVGGPEVHALNTLLTADRVKDVHVEADFRLGDADEIEAAADPQHGEPLLGHRFQTDEVENVVSASGEESADGFDRFGFGGVNDIGCAEPLRRLQPMAALVVTMAALLLTGPLLFSGIVFSTLLNKVEDLPSALAYNLLAAMLGGLLEYNSMEFGFAVLYLIAFALYGLALATTWLWPASAR